MIRLNEEFYNSNEKAQFPYSFTEKLGFLVLEFPYRCESLLSYRYPRRSFLFVKKRL